MSERRIPPVSRRHSVVASGHVIVDCLLSRFAIHTASILCCLYRLHVAPSIRVFSLATLPPLFPVLDPWPQGFAASSAGEGLPSACPFQCMRPCKEQQTVDAPRQQVANQLRLLSVYHCPSRAASDAAQAFIERAMFSSLHCCRRLEYGILDCRVDAKGLA